MKKLIITYNDHKNDVAGIDQVIAYLIWAEESSYVEGRSFLGEIDEVVFLYNELVNQVENYDLKEIKAIVSDNRFNYDDTTIPSSRIREQILRLLDNWTFINEDALNQNIIKQIKKDQIVFYYPLFSRTVKKIIRSSHNFTGYIYLDENDTTSREGFSQIENIDLFLSINDAMDTFRNEIFNEESYYDYNLIDKGIIKEAGYYFIHNTFLIASRICLVGEIETAGRAAADYLLKDIKNILYLDVSKGFPDDIPQNYNALVVSNVDLLSKQKQQLLIELLKIYEYWEGPLIFLSSKDDLFDGLKTSCELINVNRKLNNREYFLDIFLSILWYSREYKITLPYLPGSLIDNDKIKDNPLNLLFEDIDAEIIFNMLPALGWFDQDYCWESGYWYNVKLETEYQKALRSQIKQEISEEIPKEYKWIFRGAYWEVSFGYKEPILVNDFVGMYFIAHLMASPGRKWRTKFFIGKVIAGNSEPLEDESIDFDYDIDLIRKNVSDAINKIKEYEVQLSLGDELSLYLEKAFKPKTYSSGDDIFGDEKKPAFTGFDRNGYCRFYLPEPAISWKISTPPSLKLKRKFEKTHTDNG